MCVADMFTCRCDCHAEFFEGHVFHVMACCHICPTCGVRIVTPHYDSHIKDCKDDRAKIATLFGQQELDFGL